MQKPSSAGAQVDPVVASSFAHDVGQVTEALQADPGQGLSTPEAEARRARFGMNRLPEAEPSPCWLRFLSQFHQLVVYILIAAAIIAVATGEWVDALAILAIVILNGVLGFVQEERAEQALESLKQMSTPTARVRRDGRLSSLPAAELVPGDVVLVEAGDSAPADARLIEAFGLTVQEAALTGESVPVEKDAARVVDAKAGPADRTNMIFFGTSVAAGKAEAVVTRTGADTELGHIAGMLARAEREPTPLQRRLAGLGRVLVVACLSIVAVIAGLLLARGMPLSEVLLPAVSLAVAAVPEGLPAVVTVALALGLQRLVRRNALVRKLPSVETLGSVTVICSDKTGTLTRNEMTVRELIVGEVRYEVTGTGYEPRGEIKAAGGDASPSARDDDLTLALTVGLRCNNAKVVNSGDDGARWKVLGDPTEGALIVAAKKQGLSEEDAKLQLEYELPFDSTRKVMSTAFRRGDGSRVLFVKGAPEAVLERCRSRRIAGRVEPLADDARQTVLRHNIELADQALRVLGLAYRDDPPSRDVQSQEIESDLTFVGLVGMIDPPRDEVRDAVARCREAGIRPVMITGDHPSTARAIARELGIIDDESTEVLPGPELDGLSDEALAERVEHVAVYARVTAEHKLRVVRAWKSRNQVVAMTGDGVNDAPAVKAADIGIAMGITGTDVTKEASDMVLTDDNFTSIVGAVEEGRGIYDNIQKVIHYLLACNAGEVLLMLLAAIIGIPVPLTALQILWINLVTDGLPALALAVERPEPNLMQRHPRLPDSSIISRRSGGRILFHGSLIAIASLSAFAMAWHFAPGNLDGARWITFGVTAFAQLLFAGACRSRRLTWPQLGWLSNRPLLAALTVSGLLQTAVMLPALWNGMAPSDWRIAVTAVLMTFLPISVFETTKYLSPPRSRR